MFVAVAGFPPNVRTMMKSSSIGWFQTIFRMRGCSCLVSFISGGLVKTIFSPVALNVPSHAGLFVAEREREERKTRAYFFSAYVSIRTLEVAGAIPSDTAASSLERSQTGRPNVGRRRRRQVEFIAHEGEICED